jgi:hypothetical protein
MLGTPHELEHRDDLWNYFYRGLLSFNEVALVLEDMNLAESIHSYSIAFANAVGKDYTEDARTKT